jgi:hypothetical protein
VKKYLALISFRDNAWHEMYLRNFTNDNAVTGVNRGMRRLTEAGMLERALAYSAAPPHLVSNVSAGFRTSGTHSGN